MRLLQNHLFTLGLFGVVIAAFIAPELGAKQGPLQADVVVRAGIMLIFLLQGLSLPTRELLHGFSCVRLHGFIQLWIFVLSPLCLLPGFALFLVLDDQPLAAGFVYLALLPTTISSAVAFTSAAGANVAASIFSTTLANVIGVFWVPTACVLLFADPSVSSSSLLPGMLLNLFVLILLPLNLGQLLRPSLSRHPLFSRCKPHFKSISNAIILFIVFAAFSQSILDNAWHGIAAPILLAMAGSVVALCGLIHAAVWISARWLIQPADRVAALFCGSQKTLAAGVPMAVAIFASQGMDSNVNLGLLLLPLMIYHPAQLFIAALLLPHLRGCINRSTVSS